MRKLTRRNWTSKLRRPRPNWTRRIAALDLAKITADRWTELLKTASVSEQETAEKQSDYVLKQANVEAARANVQRLEESKNFDRVTAPFDGIITARNTDIGQLITASSGPELFRHRADRSAARLCPACRNRSFMPSLPARRRN